MLNWLFEIHKTQHVAHADGGLAFVCVIGLAAVVAEAGTGICHCGCSSDSTLGDLDEYATCYAQSRQERAGAAGANAEVIATVRPA